MPVSIALRPFRVIVAWVILAGISALVVIYIRERVGASGAHGEEENPVEPLSLARSAVAAGTLSGFGPLPPDEARFADVVVDLEARASKGDPQAMCRLVVEWRRCARLDRKRFDYMLWLDERTEASRIPRRPVPPEFEQLVRSQGNPADRIERRMEEFERSVAESEAHCVGLSIPPRQEIQGWLLRAARLGHRRARLEYLDLYGETWIGAPTSREIADFEAAAWPLLRAAVAAGELEPAYMAARALSPVPKDYAFPLDNTVEPNSAAAAALLSQILARGDRSDVGSYAKNEMRRLRVFLGGEEALQRAIAEGEPELARLGLLLPPTSLPIEDEVDDRAFGADECRLQ